MTKRRTFTLSLSKKKNKHFMKEVFDGKLMGKLRSTYPSKAHMIAKQFSDLCGKIYLKLIYLIHINSKNMNEEVMLTA